MPKHQTGVGVQGSCFFGDSCKREKHYMIILLHKPKLLWRVIGYDNTFLEVRN